MNPQSTCKEQTKQEESVLFENVISTFPTGGRISVNYTLGENLRLSSWDWVGIFKEGWASSSDYQTYEWAPYKPNDPLKPRRRGILFSVDTLQMPPENDYQFLYVSYYHNIVGISDTFRVGELKGVLKDDFCIQGMEARMQDEQPSGSKDNQEHQKQDQSETQRAWTYEDLFPEKLIKKKILTVVRDTVSLVSPVQDMSWKDNLQIVKVHPVVQEYIDKETQLVQACNTPIPVFDVSRDCKKTNPENNVQIEKTKEITYPEKLQLKAGPESFFQALKSSVSPCSTCQLGDSIIRDLIVKDGQKTGKIKYLDQQLRKYQKASKTQKFRESELQEDVIGIVDGCLQQVLSENDVLKQTIERLENKLAEERSKSAETKEAAIEAVVQDLEVSDEESGSDTWDVKQPKRIVRLLNTITQQSRAIDGFQDNIANMEAQLTHYKAQTTKLQKQLEAERKNTHGFSKTVGELNSRIKEILHERSKDLSNEWRTHARKLQGEDKPCDDGSCSVFYDDAPKKRKIATSDQVRSLKDNPKCKQIAKLLKAENLQKSKLHLERAQTEICSTCGLKFSRKADRHVVEEHLAFHTNFKK